VLVVATDRTAAAAAVESLSRLHAEASIVAGAEELELFLSIAHEANVRIDLVLIDDELASSCAAVAEGFQVPVVVVGRNRIESDPRALVADLFGRGGAGSTASDEVAPTEDLIDVLVAEDNAVNQIVFSQILEGFGYRYAIAANGADAVRLWRERSPRLVLMDITLPEMNGFEACRRIRELEADGTPTPVIGVLSHPFDRDREQCFASGMDDVILKPISPEMLETVFLAHMHEREAAYA
jgi:CheY-like chemotaxis protein